jgi:hypothetical protein
MIYLLPLDEDNFCDYPQPDNDAKQKFDEFNMMGACGANGGP